MKKATCLVAIAALAMFTTGCANGPVARLLRGGECDSCSALPAPAETYPNAYAMETSGTCGPNGCSTCNGGQTIGGWTGSGTVIGPMGNVDLNGGLPIQGGGFQPSAPGPANQ